MSKDELINFICDVLNLKECTVMILRQINKYVTERRYGYENIAYALAYYIDIQGGNLDPKYGIGIVPCVMDEAMKYKAAQERKQAEQRKTAQEAANRTKKTIYCHIKHDKTIKRKKVDISKIDID